MCTTAQNLLAILLKNQRIISFFDPKTTDTAKGRSLLEQGEGNSTSLFLSLKQMTSEIEKDN